MDAFKIELFEKEMGKAFPDFRTIDKRECAVLCRRFCGKMQIPKLKMPAVGYLECKGAFVENFNALQDGFNVSELFACLKVTADIIYVCWDSFETIDRMSLQDFSQHFDDIWFPAADNVIVFPQEMSFMVMVRHDGAVYFYR